MAKTYDKILFTDVTQKMTNKTLTNPTIDRVSQVYYYNHHAKVGGTAGWTVNAANDLGTLGTVAASQTAGTLVVPLTGLKVGWSITAFGLVGQIESAGGAVTVDANLRSLTAADADVTDASVAPTMTQISVTADDTIEAANSSTTLTTAETVAAGVTYYLLVTVTTAASTDVVLQGVTLTITET